MPQIYFCHSFCGQVAGVRFLLQLLSPLFNLYENIVNLIIFSYGHNDKFYHPLV